MAGIVEMHRLPTCAGLAQAVMQKMRPTVMMVGDSDGECYDVVVVIATQLRADCGQWKPTILILVEMCVVCVRVYHT